MVQHFNNQMKNKTNRTLKLHCIDANKISQMILMIQLSKNQNEHDKQRKHKDNVRGLRA